MKQILLGDAEIKSKFEDFLVEEISFVPPFISKQNAQYSYLRLTKKGLTTFQGLDRMSTYFGVPSAEINSEGLKDEDGITAQIVSIKKILPKYLLSEFNKKFQQAEGNSLSLALIGYGVVPVNEQFLHGNKFRIVVRNMQPDVAERLYLFCKKNRNSTILNYYDYQRFGLPSGPFTTHILGEKILKQDWEGAFELFLQSGNFEMDFQGISPGAIKDKAKFFKEMNYRKVGFFIASYHSYLWNKKLSDLIKDYTQKELVVIPGHKVGINIPGDCLIPAEISVIVSDLDSNFQIVTKEKRRSSIICTTVFATDLKDDDLNEGKLRLTLEYFLPSGSYATMVAKQILFKVL